MAGYSFLKRNRHGAFSFRRRVPNDLRDIIGTGFIVRSLRTSNRRDAIINARSLAAQTDRLFQHLRTMTNKSKLKDSGASFDLIFKVDFHESGATKSVYIEADTPDEQANALEMLRVAKVAGPVLVTKPEQPKGNGGTITEAWEAYKEEKGQTGAWKDAEHAAKYHHWPPVRDFIALIGDKPISAVTVEDAARFQRHVLSTNPDESARNKDKRLTRAGALFRWAKSKRVWGVTEDFGDLFSFPDKRKIKDNPYLKFETDELKALFESDEYKTGRFERPSDYWLPLLGLHTGARLNELCQLTRADIGEHDSVPTISILDEEEGKRLKTDASRRIVPIHSTLIKLGFLDYAASVQTGRIFPELRENPNKRGDFSKDPSRRFTDYRRKKGVGTDTAGAQGRFKTDNRKAFHSFRSTLISALRKANVPKDRRTRLAGHEYDDTQDAIYTGGDVLTMFDFRTLQIDIESINFGIDFTAYRPPQ